MRQERLLEALPIPEAGAVNALQVHSRRGDALFFLGRFKEAVREYRRMVEISPEVDASHWRLGIALFFANEAQAAADQFQKYHSFDDVDRENGIWRYLCQYQAQGAEVARRELIRYQKDDREPFPAVYRLFEGTLTTDEALQVISDDLPAAERDKRLFYTELYIGMHLVVQKKFDAARQHLHNAVSRQWPRGNGFGPDYMWHVARLQYDLLAEKPAADASAKE
jgi:lipoprotein NlpI